MAIALSAEAIPPVEPRLLERLIAGTFDQPHAILGAHPAGAGAVVRAFHPDAVAAHLIVGRKVHAMHHVRAGVFAIALDAVTPPFAYRVRFQFANGETWERDDPYRFLPTLGAIDLHLFNEGTHRRLWEKLGAHEMTVDGVAGVSFAVWAPNAARVSVLGDFCGWDPRLLPMRRLGSSGVFELFVPGVRAGATYKFDIRSVTGAIRRKTDPYALQMQQSPTWNSVVARLGDYTWGDDVWTSGRSTHDLARSPMLIYEVHIGSWRRDARGEPLGFRAIATPLAEHVKGLGFTHVELLPIAEHPFGGSWGYQVAGYFAPTSRWGTPDDFRFFVDTMHQHGIGVILDWVPAHFPKDDWALRRFDGTALYEHADPRLGEHPDWGTHIFNYARHEVRNFLLANALYWLAEFHVDGLRVDAVASMLYLDYSRKPGEWLRNRFGGRENLEAIELLRAVNEAIREDYPGCFSVAEESTAWPYVTKPANDGGLGFAFKWNMGWMHDTLEYLEEDPLNRRWHHNRMTFGMMYEYSERFVNPLSHDEVVHMKGSLLRKMPGDLWQRFANLRLLLTYQYTRPGKPLLFMGTELAPWTEWNHDVGLDWSLRASPLHGEFCAFVAELGALYRASPSLWRDDHEPRGFSWIDVNDRDQSVFSYLRRAIGDDGVTVEDVRIVVLNCTPVPRAPYRIGCPIGGTYALRFSTDDPRYGGKSSDVPATFEADDTPYHGFEHSIELALPPLGALVLEPLGDLNAQSVGNRRAPGEAVRLGIAEAPEHPEAGDSRFPIPDRERDEMPDESRPA